MPRKLNSTLLESICETYNKSIPEMCLWAIGLYSISIITNFSSLDFMTHSILGSPKDFSRSLPAYKKLAAVCSTLSKRVVQKDLLYLGGSLNCLVTFGDLKPLLSASNSTSPSKEAHFTGFLIYWNQFKLFTREGLCNLPPGEDGMSNKHTMIYLRSFNTTCTTCLLVIYRSNLCPCIHVCKRKRFKPMDSFGTWQK